MILDKAKKKLNDFASAGLLRLSYYITLEKKFVEKYMSFNVFVKMCT